MHRRTFPLWGLLLAALALAISAAPARAQSPHTLPAADALSDRTTAWVVTLGLGEQPHTLFGHTAVVVRDPALNFSVAFNYGTFDFGDGFLWKFLGGRLDYRLSATSGLVPMREALFYERGYIQQQLALTPTQARMLYRELRREAQPENREYRYRFLDRNCSTKVVDVLKRSLGDALIWPSPDEHQASITPTDTPTYRGLLRGHLRDRPWYRLGIDVMLGQPTDRPVTGRDRGFLPIHLADLLDGTLIHSGDAVRPLVAHRDTNALRGLPDTTRHTPLYLAVALLALGIVGTAAARWKRDILRWPLRIVDGLLLFAAGLCGIAIAGMWVGSAHDVIGPNWNLPWAVPLHAVAAVWVIQRPQLKWLRVYLAFAALLAAAVTLTWPILPQGMPLALWPIAGLLALRCTARALPKQPRTK
ncbi:MAG: DUF4105 domain-containing protein [Phycisphaeraceae bacterium]